MAIPLKVESLEAIPEIMREFYGFPALYNELANSSS